VTDRYILIGQTPVPCEDLMEWARWHEDEREARIVRQQRVMGLCYVSTVFLGLDHSFSFQPHCRPILFESMAFWDDEGGYEQERCSTWAEAEAQHEEMVRAVAAPRAVLRFVGRTVRDWRQNAGEAWGRAWRDLHGQELTDTEKMLDQMKAAGGSREW
jgi:hypothetical protein